MNIVFIGITKACCNATQARDIYVRVPRGLGIPKGTVGRLVRCCYGTRDASLLGEYAYAVSLHAMGFRRGGTA